MLYVKYINTYIYSAELLLQAQRLGLGRSLINSMQKSLKYNSSSSSDQMPAYTATFQPPSWIEEYLLMELTGPETGRHSDERGIVSSYDVSNRYRDTRVIRII